MTWTAVGFGLFGVLSLDSNEGHGHGEGFNRLFHVVSKCFQDIPRSKSCARRRILPLAARAVELLPAREKVGNAGPSTPLLLPGPAKYASEDGQDATSKALQTTSSSCQINYRAAQNIRSLCSCLYFGLLFWFVATPISGTLFRLCTAGAFSFEGLDEVGPGGALDGPPIDPSCSLGNWWCHHNRNAAELT